MKPRTTARETDQRWTYRGSVLIVYAASKFGAIRLLELHLRRAINPNDVVKAKATDATLHVDALIPTKPAR